MPVFDFGEVGSNVAAKAVVDDAWLRCGVWTEDAGSGKLTGSRGQKGPASLQRSCLRPHAQRDVRVACSRPPRLFSLFCNYQRFFSGPTDYRHFVSSGSVIRFAASDKTLAKDRDWTSRNNRQQISGMLDCLVPGGQQFFKLNLHGNTTWLPQTLTSLVLGDGGKQISQRKLWRRYQVDSDTFRRWRRSVQVSGDDERFEKVSIRAAGDYAESEQFPGSNAQNDATFRWNEAEPLRTDLPP
ncbi:MAG: hypothetical protein R3C59_28360 [Planctomycetaceae bacterium]